MQEREKQIEEMAKVLENAKIDAHATIGSMNRGFGVWYANALYTAGYRKQSEWISVEERLPEHKQLVLGYIVDERIGEQTIAAVECRYQELDTWYFPPLCEWEKVTHWMPLPKAPKGGE